MIKSYVFGTIIYALPSKKLYSYIAIFDSIKLYTFILVCQEKSLTLLGANELSGFVAHNLSGYNENHKGGFHERAQIYYRRIGKCNLNGFIQTGVPKMVIPIAVLIAFFHVLLCPPGHGG